MADVNYSNPSSLDPGLGFKPEGFLGGYEWSQRDRMFKDAQSLQDLLQRNVAVKSGMELGEFQQNAPIRQAAGLADLAKHQATIANVGTRMANEARLPGSQADNFEATTAKQNQETTEKKLTQDSRVAATIAQEVQKQGATAVKSFQQQTEAYAAAATKLAMEGPGGAANAAQLFKQLGMPDEQIIQMIGDGKPTTIKANFDRVQKILQDANMELKKVQMQGENQLKVQSLANAGSLAVAKERATAKNKSNLDYLKAATTPEQMIARAQIILSDPESDANAKIIAEELAKKGLMLQKNRDAAKMGPTITPQGIVPPKLNYEPAGPNASKGIIKFGDMK